MIGCAVEFRAGTNNGVLVQNNALQLRALTENTAEGPRVTETSVDFPNGFEYEIVEFIDLYRRGELESRLQSAEDSIRTAALLEGIAASSRE